METRAGLTPFHAINNNTPSNAAVFSDIEVWRAVVMMCFVVVIGSIGNILVMIVLCIKNSSANSRWNRYRRQQRASAEDTSESASMSRDRTLDFFVLVLAVSDALVCTLIIPSTIVMEMYQFRIVNDLLCKLYYVLFVTNTTFSSLLISAVALDRYLFICHSLKHILTLFRAKILVSSLALFSLSVGIAAGCVVGAKEIHQNSTEVEVYHICEEIEFMDEISRSQKVVSQVIKYFNHACYLACILIVLILYSCVFWAVVNTRQSSHKLTVPVMHNRQNGRDSGSRKGSLKNTKRMTILPSRFRQKAHFTLQNLRSALMLFIIALVYIFTFVPALVIANGWVHQNLVLLYLYYVNSAANPCIYALFTPSFRETVVALVRSCCCLKSPPAIISARNSLRSERGRSSTIISVSEASSKIIPHFSNRRRSKKEEFPFISREERRARAMASVSTVASSNAEWETAMSTFVNSRKTSRTACNL